MASKKLVGMDVPALLDLRDAIDTKLHSLRSALTDQLAAIGGAVGIGRGKRQHARMVNHPLAGRKVAAKYEDPETGATWAGRGATPRLRVYEEVGRSREEFSLKSRSAGGAKKPGRKPGRPKKVRR